MSDKSENALVTQGQSTWVEPQGVGVVRAFIPTGFNDVLEFSSLLAHSGDMVPKAYMNNKDKIATAIFFGYELGLQPLQALQSIAVINGKPSIYGDAALALVRSSRLLEDFEEFYEGEMFLQDGKTINPNYKAVCKITRVGAKRPVIAEFSIGDAQMANLWNKEGPWRNYPKRMLKMRARGFGLRDEFTDVLRGLILTEEADDYEMRDITPKEPPAPDGDGDAGDAPRRGRGRPRKTQDEPAPANKYTTTDKAGAVIEGDIVKGDQKPAETDTKQADADKNPPIPDSDRPKQETKPATQAETKEEIPSRKYGQEVSKMVTNLGDFPRDFQEFLRDLHRDMDGAATLEALRAEWNKYFKKRALTAEELEATKFVRDHHKRRLDPAAAAPKQEQPPAPDEDASKNPPPPEFDYDSFKKDVDKTLNDATTPDEVLQFFSDMTEVPLREKLISEEQMEHDLRPIAQKHMNRVDV